MKILGNCGMLVINQFAVAPASGLAPTGKKYQPIVWLTLSYIGCRIQFITYIQLKLHWSNVFLK